MEEHNEGTNSSFKNKLKELHAKFIPKTQIALIISLIGNVLMLIFGGLAVHKCPANENIPLFLVVTGVVGLMSKFFTYIRGRFVTQTKLTYIESGLYTIETIFFILGAYWVFSAFKPSYEPNDKEYCLKSSYMFAFIYLAVYIGIMIAIIVGFLCFVLSAYLLSRNSGGIDIESNAK